MQKRNKNTAAVALPAAQSGHQAAAMLYQRRTARAQSMQLLQAIAIRPFVASYVKRSQIVVIGSDTVLG